MKGLRLLILAVVFLALLGGLVARLAQLQIGQHEHWLAEAERSRTRVRSLPFHRGRVLDRAGRVLAEDRPVYDLKFIYRDFRRGHLAGQLLEAFALLGQAPGSLHDCLRGAENLGEALLDLRPRDLERLSRDEKNDLVFYLGRLFELPSSQIKAWLEQDRRSLIQFAQDAPTAYIDRLRAARRDMAGLERDLGQEPGSLLETAEEERMQLELRVRIEAARVAAGRGFEWSRHQVRRVLSGAIPKRQDFLEKLADRWTSREGRLEPVALGGILDGAPGESLDEAMRRLGALLRHIEDVMPADVSGTRRQLVRDLHARERRLTSQLPFEAVDRLVQAPAAYPGFYVEESPRRIYPLDAIPHIVGRVSVPDEARIEEVRSMEAEYRELARRFRRTPEQEQRYRSLRSMMAEATADRGESRGVTGVERDFNERLRGERGYQDVLEVAQRGIRPQELAFEPPVHGESVQLELDVRLCRAAERAIQRGYLATKRALAANSKGDQRLQQGLDRPRAGLVLLDLRDGSVPVLVTWPSYSRTHFRRDYDRLLSDPGRPFAHRGLGFLYEGSRVPYPGSTFKLLVAMAALQDNSAAWMQERVCEGSYKEMACEAIWGHGPIAMDEALVRSCNVYFYKLGEELGYERMATSARELGFGAPTGFGLASLEKGVNRLSKLSHSRRGGDRASRHLAIGQAHVIASPLQLARFYGWLATGKLWQPRLVHRIGQELQPQHFERPSLSDGIATRLRQAMQDVVEDPIGTAHGRGLEEFYVAGKTGTAQVQQSDPRAPSNVHGWFAGYFPAQDPRWAVAVLCENTGLHGGDCAAYVLREFLASEEAAVLFEN